MGTIVSLRYAPRGSGDIHILIVGTTQGGQGGDPGRERTLNTREKEISGFGHGNMNICAKLY